MGKDLAGNELGAGLLQRKNGRYCARYVDRFGNRKSIYGGTLKEVKKLLNQAIYENELGISQRKSITLDRLYDIWLNLYKRDTIRPSTLKSYTQCYELHIRPKFGSAKLDNIHQEDIKRFLKGKRDNGYGYESTNKLRIMLADMFNVAIANDYMNKNPAKGIKLKRDENVDIRWLTVDEQNTFFDCCKGTFYDNFFTVAINTGLRIGELAALREQDIDFENGVIKVTRTLLYQKLEGDDKKMFHFGAPKTKTSIRNVPINKRCAVALKNQLIQKQVVTRKATKVVEKEFEDLIFTTKYNTPINPQIVCDAIEKIINEINLTREYIDEIEPFSCHCFRRTFATRCFEADIPAKTVQAYLGHATLQMTMDLYTKVMPKKQQEDMLRLDNFLDRLDNEKKSSIDQNIACDI